MFDPALIERAVALLAKCRERGLKLATAESCTGGLVAGLLTEIPGSSAVVERGFVVYSNLAKQEMLGVPEATIVRWGAVSAATARAMVEGALAHSAADFAVAVTGIAGPGGGTAEKPVGTVFIALASAAGVEVKVFLNAWDRATFKQVTATQALEWLRRAVSA